MAVEESVSGGVFTRMTPQECRDAIAAGKAVMLDIRRVEEFAAERIPGAMLAPMEELEPVALPAQGEKSIILQCRSGARTANLAYQMLEAGLFDSIGHLEGGIMGWKAAGLPTICPDPARAVR